MRKIILFELNEVPWFIVDDFTKKNPTSALAHLVNHSTEFETSSQDIGSLSPWITWPSVHRGVNNQKHGIYDLGQNLDEPDKNFPPVWKILTNSGVKTGIFGSLHTYPLPQNLNNYCFYVPDSFASDLHCFPDYINTFQEFNLAMARTSARNVSSKVEWNSAVNILRSKKKLGIKFNTLFKLGQQLVHEKIDVTKKCRRRTHQAILSFDIFFKQLNKTKPDICTYFTNHVASAMHRYWAAAYPYHYENNKYDEFWINTYQYEIDFAMIQTDFMLKKLIKFMQQNTEYDLWILSSMGQAAVDFIPLSTQLYLINPEKFMTYLGLQPETWSSLPCMLPQANFKIEERAINFFKEKLKQIKIDNQSLGFREEQNGFFSLDFGHGNLQENIATIENVPIALESLGLKNVKIEDQSTSSAYHIPQGILMIYSPEKSSSSSHANRPEVSALSIAPTILKNFGIEKPNYMTNDLNI